MNKLLTIAQNTFTETLRQPIYAVLVTCAILLFFLLFRPQGFLGRTLRGTTV